MAQTRRIPPPKSQKADWGVIGSRIPKVLAYFHAKTCGTYIRLHGASYGLTIAQDTMRALRPLYNRTDKTWLFAACNEASSRTIAGAGVEVRFVTGEIRCKSRQRCG